MTEHIDTRPLPGKWVGFIALLAGIVCSTAAIAQTQNTPTPRPLGNEFQVYSASADADASDQAPDYEEPQGALTLRAALALALLRSPDLAAFSWSIRVQEAEALQAGLLPNPEIGVEAENFAGSGEYSGYDSAETTIFLGQLVELGGKRGKRRRVAELERDLSGWDYEIRRLDVFTSVTQTFVDVLEAQQRFALAKELLKIASESLEAVSKQLRAGATSAVEQTRASVSVARARVDLRRAQAALETARTRLSALWGAGRATFGEATGKLSEVTAPPSLELLENRLANNPDLARWATELAHREAVVALEDARAIPNFTVGAGVRRFSATDDTAMVMGVTVPIPVFNRNQGAKHAARSERSRARSEQRSALVRVRAALEATHQGLRANFDELTALRESVIPQAERAFDGVETGYLRGLFRYVDVLESQRTLFELRDNELVALGSYHRAVAELERLTGEALPQANQTPAPRDQE